MEIVEVTNLNETLKNNVVVFTFKKNNGEVRHATGTRYLRPDIAIGFTDNDKPKGVKKELKGIITFWDLDKQAWRSCREDSVISIDTVITEDDLLGGSLF